MRLLHLDKTSLVNSKCRASIIQLLFKAPKVHRFLDLGEMKIRSINRGRDKTYHINMMYRCKTKNESNNKINLQLMSLQVYRDLNIPSLGLSIVKKLHHRFSILPKCKSTYNSNKVWILLCNVVRSLSNITFFKDLTKIFRMFKRNMKWLIL